MKTNLIFLPGIMGSELSYTLNLKTSKEKIIIWGDDYQDSLIQMSRNPNTFKLIKGIQLDADKVIDYVSGLWGYVGVDVYASMQKCLMQLEDFNYYPFPYDWRQDIQLNAEKLGNFCNTEFPEGSEFSFVGHSLGGLIINEMIYQKHLSESSIKKVITIGTPFYGSPSAMRGLYDPNYLPGLSVFKKIFNFRLNKKVFRRVLLENFETFSSIYQLMPDISVKFVETSSLGNINPLDGKINLNPIVEHNIKIATKYHEKLKLTDCMNYEKLPELYTKIDFLRIVGIGLPTEWKYSLLEENGDLVSIYCQMKVDGDGRVPEKFAHYVAYAGGQHSIPNEEHMRMCSSPVIQGLVSQYL